MAYLRRFNDSYDSDPTLIRKALSSDTNIGAALIPQQLEKTITNTVLRLMPFFNLIDPQFAPQKTHEFNRLTSLPTPGSAMGENAVTPTRNSTYTRQSVDLKILRRKGAVTGFLKDAAADYVDSEATEMEANLVSHMYDVMYTLLYGNAEANQYEFSGWDTHISTNRFSRSTRGAGVQLPDLRVLDEMIDENLALQGQYHRKCFLMSPQMLSRVSALLTNVRLNQSVSGDVTKVDIGGGHRLDAYRDIPIVPTTAVRPKANMTTITATDSTTGGSIAASSAYRFVVAPMTVDGEQGASAEVTGTTGSGTTNSVSLSYTAYPGAVAYKVYYRATSTADYSLIKMIAGNTYDSNGTISSAITSTTITSLSAGSDVPSGMQSDQPMICNFSTQSIPERIYLLDLDRIQGLGKVVYTNTSGDKFKGLVTVTPLAITDDLYPFMVKSYMALVPSYEGTSVVMNGYSAR